jgi:hypothetical protein
LHLHRAWRRGGTSWGDFREDEMTNARRAETKHVRKTRWSAPKRSAKNCAMRRTLVLELRDAAKGTVRVAPTVK